MEPFVIGSNPIANYSHEVSSLTAKGVKFQNHQGRKTKDIKVDLDAIRGENALKQVTFLSFATRTFQASCVGGIISVR